MVIFIVLIFLALIMPEIIAIVLLFVTLILTSFFDFILRLCGKEANLTETVMGTAKELMEKHKGDD